MHRRQLLTFFAVAALTVVVLSLQRPAFAGPQFSRQHNTSCNTCHTVYPQLNDLGKAFQYAVFQFPEQDQALIETPKALLTWSAPPMRSEVLKRMFGVVPPSRISEPEAHTLQAKYLDSLEALAQQLKAHHFPFRFCLGPTGLDAAGLQCDDQHSIHFGNFSGQNLVEITGVYYASYSRRSLNVNQRSQQTFRDVILPILQLAARQFQDDPEIKGYAIEVSHYVRGKVLGVPIEAPENLAIVLPSTTVKQLLDSKHAPERQSIFREGQAFLNAEPFSLDLSSALAPRPLRTP